MRTHSGGVRALLRSAAKTPKFSTSPPPPSSASGERSSAKPSSRRRREAERAGGVHPTIAGKLAAFERIEEQIAAMKSNIRTFNSPSPDRWELQAYMLLEKFVTLRDSRRLRARDQGSSPPVVRCQAGSAREVEGLARVDGDDRECAGSSHARQVQHRQLRDQLRPKTNEEEDPMHCGDLQSPLYALPRAEGRARTARAMQGEVAGDSPRT